MDLPLAKGASTLATTLSAVDAPLVMALFVVDVAFATASSVVDAPLAGRDFGHSLVRRGRDLATTSSTVDANLARRTLGHDLIRRGCDLGHGLVRHGRELDHDVVCSSLTHPWPASSADFT